MMPKARKAKLILVREPNGRPSRTLNEREFPPAQVKRLRDAAMAGLRDPEWGTELGRLYLEGILTAEMYAAGKWWRETASRYRGAICAPAPDPKAIMLEAGCRSSQPDPDSDAGRELVKRDSMASLVFLEAHGALLGAGMIAERAVRRLCEEDQSPIGEEERIATRRGLLWVAKYRGLTPDSKSRQGYVR
jgi:hypothetical protein